MSSWTCDGVPKDGKQYAGVAPHAPHQNTGPDCIICGLPQEAMQAGKGGQKPAKTVFMGGSHTPSWLIPLMIVLALLLIGGGIGSYLLLRPKQNQPLQPVSPTSPTPTNPTTVTPTQGEYVSRGEQIFLKQTPDKNAGADAFAQADWEGAIAAYQRAIRQDPNDPEGRIYLNNAQAQQGGNPLTIAVAVPATVSPNSAAEILRGVAKYQEEHNQISSNQPLEVAIIDNSEVGKAANLAQEIIDTSDILGIVGYGIDSGSQAALQQYEGAGMAVLSPLTTSFEANGSQSLLKTISPNEKAQQLLGNYLQAAAKTLVKYAAQLQASPSVAIFYNSDSDYSQQLQQEIINLIPEVQGNVVEKIEITDANFTAENAINNLQSSGAEIAILALSKNKVSQAVEIAEANQNSNSPLILMGGDELYNADILIQGGEAIAGIILAVPWSFSPNDPFAQDAIDSWKGRVSWRTATAYDATKALSETVSNQADRSSVKQAFDQGVNLTDSTTDFNLFKEVPLVKAVPGNQGPKGSDYQFDSLQ